MDRDDNHDAQIIGVVVAGVVLSVLSVLARLGSKVSHHHRIDSDEWLLIAALFICAGESFMLMAAIWYANAGRHTGPDDTTHLIKFGKTLFAGTIMQPTILYLSKLSVLILLHRIFITTSFRLTVKILSAITTAWFVAVTLADILICRPVSGYWNPSLVSHCGSQTELNIVSPIPWIVTDLAILVAPVPMVVRLQVPRETKIGILCLLLLGVFTTAVSIARYTTIFYKTEDPTYDVAAPFIWNIAEANVTITCAALLGAKPALSAVFWFRRSRRLTLATVSGPEIEGARGTWQTTGMPINMRSAPYLRAESSTTNRDSVRLDDLESENGIESCTEHHGKREAVDGMRTMV